MTYKILIIAPSWIGDSVMAEPLYRRLHELHPDLELHVFAPAWILPTLSHMSTVNKTHLNTFGHGALRLFDRYKVAKELRALHFDQAIVLPNSFKSALIPFFAKIPKRTGFVGESRRSILNDTIMLNETELPKMVQRFYALSDTSSNVAIENQIAYPILTFDPKTQAEAVTALGLDTSKKIVAFCPGAEYGPAKRWPATHFASLAKMFAQKGYSIWLFGSEKDQEISAQINQLSNNICIDLCGKTKLSDAIDLLALSSLVVCNDSGLMHVAAALGRPLVALYGSSSPDFTPPLSKQAKICSINLECSPCFERDCPLGHTHCLTEMLPEQIWQTAQTLISKKPIKIQEIIN